MKILVTGVAGFIGSHVTRRLLTRGDEVIGVDNLNDYYDPTLKQMRLDEISRLNSGRFTFHKADFSDYAGLVEILDGEKIDRIIHLGAQAGVRYSIENPHAYATANLVGHLNIIELARHRSVEHCVYASSSSVYGGNDTLPFSVRDRVDNPVSLYAATKKADELMSESYAHLYRVPMTGLRFFTVYGPWGRPDMAMWIFARKILAGEPIDVFNHGAMRRDFTFIDDIVSGIVAALDHPPADDGAVKAGGSRAPHAIYNLGNSRSEELGKMISLIETACGREAIKVMRELQMGDVPDTFADIEDARRDLGFEPKTTIDAGIPIFVDWLRGYFEARAR